MPPYNDELTPEELEQTQLSRSQLASLGPQGLGQIPTISSVSPIMPTRAPLSNDVEENDSAPAIATKPINDKQALYQTLAKKYGFSPGITDEDLQKTQQQARVSQLIAGLGQAADTAATGIGTPWAKNDQSFYTQAQKNSQIPVEDLLARRKAAIQSNKFGADQRSQDPNSPGANALRTIYGAYMKKNNVGDPSILSGMSEAEIHDYIGKPIEMQQKAAEIHAQHEATAAYRDALGKAATTKADASLITAKSKISAADKKQLESLGSKLDEMKGRGGPLAKQTAIRDGADRILVLAQQNPSLNFDKRQMEELAIGSAALLSQGNAPAQSIVDALVPKTAGKDAAGIVEWLTSQPTGTNQQAFAKRMLETAQRERHLADHKIKTSQFSRVAETGIDLSHPDAQAVLQSHLGGPQALEEYQKYKANGYQMPEFTGSPVWGTPNQALSSGEGAIRNAQNGGGMPSTPPGMVKVRNKKTGEIKFAPIK